MFRNIWIVSCIVCVGLIHGEVPTFSQITPENEFHSWAIGIKYSPLQINLWEATGSGFTITMLTEATASLTSVIRYHPNPKWAIDVSLTLQRSEAEQYYKKTIFVEEESITGEKVTSTTNSIHPEVLINYYLLDPATHKVNPFLTAGIGKQFFQIHHNVQSLEETESNYIIITNTEDAYDEELNSPLFLLGGFGAEYSLNSALSISLNTTFEYKHIKASYQYRKESITDPDYFETRNRTLEQVQIDTRISFGIFFHF